jgi:D-sedoheptulose 7-phosphate isomerase
MEMLNTLYEAAKRGNKILIAGNGGLCAESEHFAAELMGKYAFDVYIPCVALTANSSLITALANDIGYQDVFTHQIDVLGCAGDVFIGMTTSKSKNIIRACDWAEYKGLKVILLDGEHLDGNGVAEKQEYAIKLLHKLAYDLKERLYCANCKSQ